MLAAWRPRSSSGAAWRAHSPRARSRPVRCTRSAPGSRSAPLGRSAPSPTGRGWGARRSLRSARRSAQSPSCSSVDAITVRASPSVPCPGPTARDTRARRVRPGDAVAGPVRGLRGDGRRARARRVLLLPAPRCRAIHWAGPGAADRGPRRRPRDGGCRVARGRPGSRSEHRGIAARPRARADRGPVSGRLPRGCPTWLHPAPVGPGRRPHPRGRRRDHLARGDPDRWVERPLAGLGRQPRRVDRGPRCRHGRGRAREGAGCCAPSDDSAGPGARS